MMLKVYFFVFIALVCPANSSAQCEGGSCLKDETSLVQMQQAIKRHSGEANLTTGALCSKKADYIECKDCKGGVWCKSAGCVQTTKPSEARDCCKDEDSIISNIPGMCKTLELDQGEKDPTLEKVNKLNKLTGESTDEVARALQHCFVKRAVKEGEEFDVVMQSGTATFYYGCSPGRFNDIDLWSKDVSSLFAKKVPLEEAYLKEANVVWDTSNCEKKGRPATTMGLTDKCTPEGVDVNGQHLQIYCPEQTKANIKYKEIDVWPGIKEKFDKDPFLTGKDKEGLATVAMRDAQRVFTVKFHDSKTTVNVKVVTACHLIELKTALALKGGRDLDSLKDTDYSDLDCMCSKYGGEDCQTQCGEYCKLCTDGTKTDDRTKCMSMLKDSKSLCTKLNK